MSFFKYFFSYFPKYQSQKTGWINISAVAFLAIFPPCMFYFVCFLAASSQFVALANKDVNLAGRTKLDRERLKTCMREMVRLVQRINSICVCERQR